MYKFSSIVNEYKLFPSTFFNTNMDVGIVAAMTATILTLNIKSITRNMWFCTSTSLLYFRRLSLTYQRVWPVFLLEQLIICRLIGII